jgi:hypothetical protein
MMTGKSASGVLHLYNKTPVDWYGKKQGTAETATYGTEFVAARTATEQIIDNRTTLRHLGVAVKESIMFGDNEFVVNSSNMPAGKLHKRHIALSWHRVREATTLRELSVPLTCSASIGDMHRPGRSSKHCCFGKVIPRI